MEIAAFAPDAETMERGRQLLPQRRMRPGAVGDLDGPGSLGPEAAGALSLVYAGFAEAGSAQRGYRHFAEAQAGMLQAPGFLRWISFADGPHGYGLGFWRNTADAAAFARSDLHQRLVKEQRQAPFEYSQFAGIWAAVALGRRTFSCPHCNATTAAPATACAECGTPLADGFNSPDVDGR